MGKPGPVGLGAPDEGVGLRGNVGGRARVSAGDRSKTPHVFNRHEWECFLTGAKNGEFDLPVA
ncbi:MAG TPA: hypothetical protein VGS06_08225 [Streptosporangiaceae bacterium]|nr:hypothetical protein [Streptosporangiaceae bacterium]